jgi:hypothetical protein
VYSPARPVGANLLQNQGEGALAWDRSVHA